MPSVRLTAAPAAPLAQFRDTFADDTADAAAAYGESVNETIACTRCGAQICSLLDQLLELRALVICQCRCGELSIVLKPAPRTPSSNA